MKSLIIGYGEIGKSLEKVLTYYCAIIEKDGRLKGANSDLIDIEIMHICFPYSDNFENIVKKYQEEHKPKFTVVHSTVPVGTCRKLNAISSPCLGIHPHLAQSLKTFTKFLGGAQANEVADYFRRAGIKVYITAKSETTELMKILDTTFYGVCIEYTKDVQKQCKKYDVPFEAWSLWTNNYNQGYQKLGYPEYVRPNLIPMQQKIGGHCVVENSELLDSIFTKLITRQNKKL